MFRPLAVTLALLSAPALHAQEVTLVAEGAEDGLTEALRAASLTLAQAGGATPVAAQDIVAAARADYRRLLTALYAEGRYGGTISIRLDGREAAAIQPLDAPDRIATVEIAVDPGPAFTLSQAAIGPLAPGTVLPEGFVAGAPARAAVIREAARSAVEGWRDAGHALATPGAQAITARHAEATLSAEVAILPGPQLRFAPLVIASPSAVREARIREIAGLPEGEVFSPLALTRAADRLRRAGPFGSVALSEADAAGPGDTLTITAQLTDLPPRRLGFSAEISSSEGLALEAYWLHRNLLGGAERLRLGAAITGIESGIPGLEGGPDYALTFEFGRPATLNADTDLEFDIAIARLDEADFLVTGAQATLGLTRYVREDLTYRLGVSLLTAHEETATITRDYTLFTLPLEATLDRRAPDLSPREGWYLRVEAEPFASLSSDAAGLRLLADARAYRELGERLVLAGRVQLGSTAGAGPGEAPADFLFYAGGSDTVRGQPYQSLGLSRLEGGALVESGGTSLLGAQVEARFDVTGTIGLVGFYDIASIGDGALPQGGDAWQAGAGFGLRYETSIGAIRLDLATPASGGDAGRELQVYLGIGQAF